MPADRARPTDVLLDGFSLAFTEGRSAAAPVLERAATGLADERVSIEEVLRWGWLATAAAVMVWDYETCLAVAARGSSLPARPARTVLAVSANVMAQATTLGGEFGRATSLVAGADAVTEATGAGRAVRRPRARRISGPRDPRHPLVETTIKSSPPGVREPPFNTAAGLGRCSSTVLAGIERR